MPRDSSAPLATIRFALLWVVDRRTPQLPLSNHEGLFDNASPPAGSVRGTMSAVDGFRLGLAGEGGFGEGGPFLEAQYAAYGRDSDTEGLGSVSKVVPILFPFPVTMLYICTYNG